VGLEDKLDRLEEAFEEFEYGYAKPATDETVSALEERIGGLEKKLDDNRSDLARVEDKLDRLFAALDTASNGDARTAGDAGEKGEG
jgi:predicted RNase H-like nuclease (RuvC/YqgF family)